MDNVYPIHFSESAEIPPFYILELSIHADGSWEFDEEALLIFLKETTTASARDITIMLSDDRFVAALIKAWYLMWRCTSGQDIPEMEAAINHTDRQAHQHVMLH